MNNAAEIRSFAVFRSELPDDSVEQNDQILTPGGRNILAAICRQLESSGFTPKQPTQHSFYGWASDFQLGKIKIWLLLQCPDPWLLIVESRASWWTGGKAKEEALIEGIRHVNAAIKAEPLLKQVQWVNQTEFEELERGSR